MKPESTAAPRVVISNGFGRFALADAAAEAARHGRLAVFVTGAYPRGRPIFRRFGARGARLTARQVDVPEHVVRALWAPELVLEAGRLAGGILGSRGGPVRRRLEAAAQAAYGRAASAVVDSAGRPGMVYHYRSAFGGDSVAAARARGMVCLCDHSLAHPALLNHLVEHGGAFPSTPLEPDDDPVWRAAQRDLDAADAVVVNSRFVADTFLHQGYPRDRLHVVEWSVDDAFLDAAASLPPREARTGPLRLLFAGTVERRKGVDVLFRALAGLGDVSWTLEIVGPIDAAARSLGRSFRGDARVTWRGELSRRSLAERLSRADVFVFPSLAEGSARVVQEALALGCFVITTPNSGSVVEDGVHGLVVPPGDADAFAAAIRSAAQLAPRLDEIAARNRELIDRSYRQEHYWARLAALYAELARSASSGGTTPGNASLPGYPSDEGEGDRRGAGGSSPDRES